MREIIGVRSVKHNFDDVARNVQERTHSASIRRAGVQRILHLQSPAGVQVEIWSGGED